MKLLQVEPMSHHRKMLTVRWAARLNSSGDATNFGVKVFHYAIQPARTPIGVCLPRLAMANLLWNNPLINKLHPPLLRVNAVKPIQPLDIKTKKSLRHESIMDLDKDSDNVAGAVQVEEKDPIRLFLCANSGINREDRWLLLQWILGAVTSRHEPCKQCEETLTRKHASECSGSETLMENLHPEVAAPACEKHTRISAVLNHYRNFKPSDTSAYKNACTAIQAILVQCRGLRKRPEDGFWVEDAPEDDNLQDAAPPSQAPQNAQSWTRGRQDRRSDDPTGVG